VIEASSIIIMHKYGLLLGTEDFRDLLGSGNKAEAWFTKQATW
jgi:hypothetical protein